MKNDLTPIPGCICATCVSLRKHPWDSRMNGNGTAKAHKRGRGTERGNFTKAELLLMRSMRKVSWYLCLRGDLEGQRAYRTVLEAFHEWSMMTGIDVPGDMELGLCEKPE